MVTSITNNRYATIKSAQEGTYAIPGKPDVPEALSLEWPFALVISCCNEGKAVSHELGVCPCFLGEKGTDIAIIELKGSSATVALAAEDHGVKPAQIAKTLSLSVGEKNLLVVTRGVARLDNKKRRPPSAARREFSTPKRSWPSPGTESAAAGPTNSALCINPARTAELIGAEWVDVCQIET